LSANTSQPPQTTRELMKNNMQVNHTQQPTTRPPPFVSAILFGAFFLAIDTLSPSFSSASSFLISPSRATFTIKHVQKQNGILRKEGGLERRRMTGGGTREKNVEMNSTCKCSYPAT
jgi:hypothetical protein